MLKLSQFQKIIKNNTCRALKGFFFQFLLEVNCLYKVSSFKSFSYVGARSFEAAKTQQTEKKLTCDLDFLRALSTSSHQVFSCTCFRALNSFMWNWFFNGILLAHRDRVVRPWKLHEGAVCQWFRVSVTWRANDFFFLFSILLCTHFEVSNNVFLWLGDLSAHFYTYWECTYHFDGSFYLKFQSCFYGEPKKTETWKFG